MVVVVRGGCRRVVVVVVGCRRVVVVVVGSDLPQAGSEGGRVRGEGQVFVRVQPAHVRGGEVPERQAVHHCLVQTLRGGEQHSHARSGWRAVKTVASSEEQYVQPAFVVR